jgi:cytochrome o ubiquinol oxidase subunit 1
MPKGTSAGIFIALSIFIFAFAMIWQIFWLALLGLVLAIVFAVKRTFDDHTEYVVMPKTIAAVESSYKK